MNGKDEIGKSKLAGRLVVTGRGMAMILFKEYFDKKKGGQSDIFSRL